MTMDGEMSTLATVQRLSSYPVINFAVNQVSSVYQTTKVKSDMLKGGLDKIETSVTNILTSALQPFQQQIVAADGFASRQLEKLEEKIPIVKESSDKIRTRFEDNLKANIDCVRKSYLVERVSNGIDKVLDVTDNTVEYILPGVDELEVKTASDPNQDNKITEMLEENEESATGKVDRIYTLTSKVKRRLFTQMVTRLENVKQRGPEIISKFKYSVDLIAYDKSLDKKSPFTDESVAGEESTASAKTESNIRPEGKFSYLKKELSNIRSTVSVKLQKSYANVVENKYPYIMENICSARSYIINLLAYGMTYGETYVKNRPFINDNLFRIQTVIVQVLPERVKGYMPLKKEETPVDTPIKTPDELLDTDMQNSDIDVLKQTTLEDVTSTVKQGSILYTSVEESESNIETSEIREITSDSTGLEASDDEV